MGVNEYSTTASSNTSLNGIGLSDAMVPTNIDNAFRQIMADVRAFANDTGGAMVSGGSANAQSVTTGSGVTVYVDGIGLSFVAGFTNSGAATLNVDGVGAKAIRKLGDVDVGAGDIIEGMICIVFYDASANSGSGAWLLANPAAGSVTEDSTTTFTNKAIDADDNTISNLEVDNFKAAAIITEAEGLASNDTDDAIPTAAAVVDFALANGLMTARGDIIYRDGDGPQRLPKGASGQVLVMGDDDPEWGNPSSGLSSPNVLGVAFNVMTGTFTTSSTSAADITGLSFPIGAGETWQFEVVGIYTAVENTANFRLQATGPASPVSVALAAVSYKNTFTSSAASAYATNMDLQEASIDVGSFVLTGTVANGPNAGTIQVRGSTSTGTGQVGRTAIKAWRTA